MARVAGARVVVFDLGGVLIDWNPRHLYRQLFDDEAAMERFLAEVCHSAWNEEQDRGRSFAAAIGPSLTGAMFAAGAMAAPLVVCGVLKTVYDIALSVAFRRVRPRD